jgi:dTDP-4-dehydrorhamnose reductase
MLNKNKIVVTGGTGRFGKVLKNHDSKKKYLFPAKKELNILKINSINKYLKKTKPKYLIHLAGLSRPMSIHDTDIERSINLNIVGTSNIVNVCSLLKIKVIYFSTNYVYPNIPGNYKEEDSVLPVNNYAWSKLGGECAVQMYKNSLIIRACMTEDPFIHKFAYSNMFTNFIFHKDFIKILEKILHVKGILNIGGSAKSVYNFAKKSNPNIKKLKLKPKKKINMPLNSLMNLTKLNKILKKINF